MFSKSDIFGLSSTWVKVTSDCYVSYFSTWVKVTSDCYVIVSYLKFDVKPTCNMYLYLEMI